MRALAVFAVVIALVLGATVYGNHLWQRYLGTPLDLHEPVRYEIEPGASLGAVALDLAARGWLERPAWFVWYARTRGDAGRIRAGEYELGTQTTPKSLLDTFISGEVVQHAFTIIEGTDFATIRASLLAHEAVRQTIGDIGDEQVMTRLGFDGVHPEGRFLPETYYFTRGTTDVELLQRAYRLMQDTLNELWQERAGNLPFDTPEQALVLASIIEKETALDSERERISGVFARRLARGMRLQSDPTVIYGLGANYDGNIRKRDLTTDTPYNTYTRGGLPPTPIAMPGRASIRAALQPAPGKALYFVATGDPDGSHYFSATLSEHNQAVQRYLARLRNKP